MIPLIHLAKIRGGLSNEADRKNTQDLGEYFNIAGM